MTEFVKIDSITRTQNVMVRKLIEGHCVALKNWIASNVENGHVDEARVLVGRLREYEEMYRIFIPDDCLDNTHKDRLITTM